MGSAMGPHFAGLAVGHPMIGDADLAQARAAQVTLMTATGTIRAESTGWVWDADQARSVPAPGPVVYEGRMRVQRSRNQAGAIPGGQQDMQVATHVGAIPWDAPTIRPGHTITVTASVDPAMVGVPLVVTDVEHSTLLTARRFHAVATQPETAP